MPKGLNLRFRRKSSANLLDSEPEAGAAPARSSFRVIERPETKSSATNGAVGRPFNSPLHNLRGASVDELGLGPNRCVDNPVERKPGWPLNDTRGSGGTTNSGSSGYYESSSTSARYSSSSTLPSSIDQEPALGDEDLFPKRASAKGMYQTVAPSLDEPPPPPPSFTTRAARAFSFGKQHGQGPPNPKDLPPVPPPHIAPARSHSPYREPLRERAMTQSSYASTAVPTRTELTLSTDDFGNDDFGSMFDTLKKRESQLPPLPTATAFHRTESEPMFPPRTYSRQNLTSSPNAVKFPHTNREDNDSPYSNSAHSSTSALSSPNINDGNMPGPAMGNGFLGTSMSGYAPVPGRHNSPGLERASIDSYSSISEENGKLQEQEYPNRQTQIDDGERWVRRVNLQDPQGAQARQPKPAPSTYVPTRGQHPATSGGLRPGAASPISSAGESSKDAESNSTTPRAARSELRNIGEIPLFDTSPDGLPSRAIRPDLHQRTGSGAQKRMTKAQFQALQRRDRASEIQSEEDELSGDDDYDDEDEVERAKKMAVQRRKQEANMSVYRQQMKKVTGGGPTDLPSSSASTVRPSVDRGFSAPAATGGIHFGGIGGTPPADSIRGNPEDDADDDVPLGILQAHGFPTSNRPPTRLGENDVAQQRRSSTAGSVAGGGAGQGPLPPFARRLPADPYFGAGLVNHSTRESLAMSSGASAYGMPTGPNTMQQQTPQSSMGHPGGLVGVIAGEERARAARRGSPSTATGHYNMGGRTMSMGNIAPPSMYGGAPPMPMMPPMPVMPQMGAMGTPMDANQQQMQQFMQMQMQFMQSMMQMQMGQAGQQAPPALQPPQPGDYLGMNYNNSQRPMSMASQQGAMPSGGRAMTMMNPPSGWNQAAQTNVSRPNSAMPMAGGSYAPSVSGLNISGGGPGPGYTPSLAPSERSNIGMPTRYRPVTQNGESSRTQSMTSSLTLQAFTAQQTSPDLSGTPFNATEAQTPKSTIRAVDKPKGAGAKVGPSRPADEDEDDGWAAMRQKRDEKKKSKWLRRDKSSSTVSKEPSLTELYQGLD